MPSTLEDLPQKLLSQFGRTLNESLSNTKTKNYDLALQIFQHTNKCDKPKMFFLKLQMDYE
jgi:hypothetical protein